MLRYIQLKSILLVYYWYTTIYYMIEKIMDQFTTFDLFAGIVFCILSIFIGRVLKQNQYLIVPFIFGLMYTNYIIMVIM